MSLIINNLTKEFGKTRALDNISVEINNGEFIAILGPSGCGKTTLLRIIAGFLEPTNGVVKMDGRIYSDGEASLPIEDRNLGMVFQSFALWPHMNVREHIEFPLKSKRNKAVAEDIKKDLVNKAMESTGLKKLAYRLPGELSGGQRQRVALARAIVSKPDILLMDEPLSSLDAELKVNMRKEIQDIHRMTGTTIVYVTHDQSEALAMADRVIIMKDGKIEQIGTPEEIYEKPKTEFAAVFVSKCNIIKGEWKDDIFYLRNYDVTYKRCDVDRYFIEKNLYPIRPEGLEIIKFNSKVKGIQGTIINKQYNGREIHYTVQCKEDNYIVYTEANKCIELGEKVTLIKKEETIN
ncbi:ABC transporter ATP-binding protein [Clostridium aceticum]|nr:ABC transporter ATP-binding protein [Clostridium aceticum]KJF26404.1 transporter [Clostridium aceticum]